MHEADDMVRISFNFISNHHVEQSSNFKQDFRNFSLLVTITYMYILYMLAYNKIRKYSHKLVQLT